MTKNGEKGEISAHEVRIYRLMSEAPARWFTAQEVSDEAKVARRTAGLHTLRFSKLGLVDQAEVFPAHRYRWSEFAGKRNKSYLQRLDAAADIIDPRRSE